MVQGTDGLGCSAADTAIDHCVDRTGQASCHGFVRRSVDLIEKSANS